jgi:uncharacterized membrane protein
MIYSIIAITLTITSILLVTFNKIKSKWYAWLIYFAGLFTAYSTTMVGMSVVGSDISRELLMSNLAIQNGWDLSIFDPSNTSWVVGWFVPLFYQVINGLRVAVHVLVNPVYVSYQPIGAEWIYKIVLPMIFAFTPVFLYFIFRKQIGDLKAFYASMLFIIVPVYALEICTIGKSMVAETLMALTIWVIFADWKQIYKFLVMLPLVLLTLWAHYTVGILLCMYLGGIAVLQLILRKWWSVSFDWRYLVCIIVIGGIFTWGYYSQVSKGLIWQSVSGIAMHHDYSQSLAVIQDSVQQTARPNPIAPVTPTANVTTVASDVSKPVSSTPRPRLDSTVKTYSLVTSAFGLDLWKYSWSGIGFRLTQILTQILIVLGFFWMLFKSNFAKNGIRYYRFKVEYVAGCVVALGLLGLCVILPAFASLINVTRQFHLALFFLAPMFVLAFDFVGVLWDKRKHIMQ